MKGFSIYSLALLSLIMAIFLTACSTPATNTFFPEDEMDHPESLGDPYEAKDMLEGIYGVNHLYKTEFYYDENTYHYTLYFNEDVTRSDIINFQAYFESIFLYLDVPTIGAAPYYEAIMNGDIFHSQDRPYEALSLRVYIAANKAYRADYTFEDRISSSESLWENPDMTYPFNADKKEAIETFIGKHQTSKMTLSAEKSFLKDNTLILKVNSKKNISETTLENLKTDIHKSLKPTLRADVLETNPHSFRYNRIVLIIQKKGNMVATYELTPDDEWL